MDKILLAVAQFNAIFSVATSVLTRIKDTGRQSVKAAVLKDVGEHVVAGRLPKSFGEAVHSIIEDVLNAHPQVTGNGETTDAAPVAQEAAIIPDNSSRPSSVAVRTLNDADLAAIVAALRNPGGH